MNEVKWSECVQTEALTCVNISDKRMLSRPLDSILKLSLLLFYSLFFMTSMVMEISHEEDSKVDVQVFSMSKEICMIIM